MDLAGLTKPYSGGCHLRSIFDDANQRLGQEVRQMRGHTDRAHTRSAAAVRDGEGLVQVEVHQVEAQVAGTDDAEQGVQICAVAVHQAAAAVNQLDHLFDVLIEETERVRVGEHHANDRVIAGGFERLQDPHCRVHQRGW